MKRLVIRHGFTGVKRDLRDAFGVDGPSLDELGRKQAAGLNNILTQLGIDPSTEPVAISELLRTRQTAELAGFNDLRIYAILNEVHTNVPGDQLRSMLAQKRLPLEALERAQAVLDNPPKETVWVAHGLVIMGLRVLLDIKTDPFVPKFYSITQIDV